MVDNNSHQQVVVLGSSSAGLTAALELAESEHARVMVCPQALWATVAFERVLLGSRSHGMVAL